MPLLPPDRSHICIAFGSSDRAQSLAGSGVGAAAAALSDGAADSAGAADEAAGGAADAADGAAPDGLVPPLQAATSNARIARTGTLRFLIRYSSNAKPGCGWTRATCSGPQPSAERTVPRLQ